MKPKVILTELEVGQLLTEQQMADQRAAEDGNRAHHAEVQILFVKGISSALGIPSGCVEIMEVTDGVLVDFVLHPGGREGDHRDGHMLLVEMGEQLLDHTSQLRKGAFGEYALSAELLPGGIGLSSSQRFALASRAVAAAAAASSSSSGLGRQDRPPTLCNGKVQAKDWGELLLCVQDKIREETLSLRDAEREVQEGNDRITALDREIAELRRLKAEREEEKRRKEAEDRRLEMERRQAELEARMEAKRIEEETAAAIAAADAAEASAKAEAERANALSSAALLPGQTPHILIRSDLLGMGLAGGVPFMMMF
eukprot:CAMPEP_0206458650 /NCGR_PEP_ID=MMETSP0324_2-20121206/23695_1 /ASSEMBLY_ACC=CAM_ASM_000836 /TAXON_ID=2866 /ORGANISM="Crypthecodinium cohnii, Strain Seligo" /LENGTH=311 /DNA_ID=CAMNT_0053930027 /DNA_START=1 /DNA_END=937 /DNA_ORIENTATION=-